MKFIEGDSIISDPKPAQSPGSQNSSQSNDVDAIIRKLEKLENAQNILETALNSKESLNANNNRENEEDDLSISISSDLDSIKRLMEDKDFKNQSQDSTTVKSVDALLKECTDLEKQIDLDSTKEDHSTSLILESDRLVLSQGGKKHSSKSEQHKKLVDRMLEGFSSGEESLAQMLNQIAEEESENCQNSDQNKKSELRPVEKVFESVQKPVNNVKTVNVRD